MKKNHWFKLLLALVVVVLVGCGGADSGDQEVAGGDTDGKTVVKFLTWLSEEKEADQRVKEAYEAENPDVEIQFEYVGDNQTANYYQQADLMLVGGEDIDIMLTAAPADLNVRAASDSFLDLTELVENEGISLDDEYADGMIQEMDGGVYGLPGYVTSWLVYINKDMLDAAGLDVPPLDWTWDDYAEYAEALTTDEVTGGYMHNWAHFNYMNMFSLHENNPLFSEDGTLNLDDPKLQEFIEFRKEMEEDGIITPYSTIVATQSTYRDRFFNEEIAMVPMGSFLISELDSEDSFPHDFQTTFASLPRDPEGEAGWTLTGPRFMSIVKHSKNPEAAYDFIRFYSTEGHEIKGTDLPSQADVDKWSIVELMIDNEEYYDLEALEAVLTNPDWKDTGAVNTPAFQDTLNDILIEETEKYYLGEADIDTVIKNIIERGEQANK